MYHEPLYVHLLGGELVDLWHLSPSKIVLPDICTRLSRLCRYAGATPKFYSVAQHTMNLVRMIDTRELNHKYGVDRAGRMKAGAYMHDFAEAYIGDIIAPVKSLDAGPIADLENTVLTAIVNAICPGAFFEAIGAEHAQLMAAEKELMRPDASVSDVHALMGVDSMHVTAAKLHMMGIALGVREHG
jgi:hypothetical protein